MPSRSAHLDPPTDALIAETAKLEDRNPSQIMAAAVRWYLQLSPGARNALRRLEATSGGEGVRQASWAVSRALLNLEFDALSTQAARAADTRLAPEASEDEIMSEAVRLSGRRRRDL